MGTGAGEIISSAAGAVITVVLGAILAFLCWIVKSIFHLNTLIVQFRAETITRLNSLEKKTEGAERSIWEAKKELTALWPLVPEANKRYSDEKRS